MNKTIVITKATPVKSPPKAWTKPGVKKGTKHPRSASDIDAILGKRLRAARMRSGITQEVLAQALGISFQQIQKYEKGVNRVSSARLPEIAKALGTTIDDLYGDLKQGGTRKGGVATAFEEFLSTKDGTDLVHAILKISDPMTRRKIIDIAKVLAREE